jgi:selenocysteine-specific elongation factor
MMNEARGGAGEARKIVNAVLGTAGHIDHGKSSIVRSLTGMDPDRLPEEQQRKLTIDLGFAPWKLSDGRTVGIIDVPGHERFIKNMVAGATGLDVVLLVVAADDGVMPQTLEHLHILKILGLELGVIAISKVDLVDPELVEVVTLELEDLVQGTFLEGAPMVPVSAITGVGMDELRETLLRTLDQAPRRDAEGPFRMPVQRVFSAKGFGTILTGVPLSGEVRIGDALTVMPGSRKVKVRGIQAYKETVDRARAGHSTALNLPEVSWKEVQRGAVVCAPDLFAETRLVEVRLNYLPGLKPLKNRSSVRFHVGTSETLGEVVLLESRQLLAGQSGLCQVRLEEPVVVAAGDRFIVRLHSPLILLGGGVVVGSSQHRLKSGKDFVIERLSDKERALESFDERLEMAIREATRSSKLADLARAVHAERGLIEQGLERLVARGTVLSLRGKGGIPRYVAKATLEELKSKCTSILELFHSQQPKRVGMPRRALFAALRGDDALATGVIESATGIVVEARRDLVRLASHVVRLSDEEAAYAAALEEVFERRGYVTPGRVEAISEAAGAVQGVRSAGAEAVFDWLVESGALVVIAEDTFIGLGRYEAAQDLVREIIEAQGQVMTSDFKTLLESSRKFIVPMLESFDQLGLTVRQGSGRVLR